MCVQFAIVLNDKKAKIRHLKAECMQVFVTCAFFHNKIIWSSMMVIMCCFRFSVSGNLIKNCCSVLHYFILAWHILPMLQH